MPDDKCHHFINYLPFVGLTMNNMDVKSPFITRMFEAAIMSAVAGGFAMYVSVAIIKTEIDQLRVSVFAVATQVEQVNRKIEKVRDDLYVPR
tara:strand:- start:12202 stop:12477 length:276 start_codon:yes stop_codon:yes gene_type:complete